MKQIITLAVLAALSLGSAVNANAQQASSRLSTSNAKLMLHVSQQADTAGSVTSTARLGPLSFSSKEGFGLNAATSDISGRISYRISPLTVPAGQTAAEVQIAANAHFSGQKSAVTDAVATALRAEGAATAWFAYEQVVPVTVSASTGSTTQLRTLTWFVFVDQAGTGIAANPKLVNSNPLVLEMTVFPSNSEVNLTGYASGLPQGVLRYRLSDPQTGNPITAYTDIPVGSAFDLLNPDNTPDALMNCIIDAAGPNCATASKDVSMLMDETGASSAVVRYVAPPTIVYDLTSPQPNADGTYNYRERMSLNVTERVLDYQSSCVTPTHRNSGRYNVTLQSNLYQYVVADNRTFNRVSANPFTFLAFSDGGRSYQLSQTVAASEESTLQNKIINPLRPSEYLELGTVPNVAAVALNVVNKKEFCERTCDFPTTNYTVGSNACTTGAVSLPHKGQAVYNNTKQDFLGTVSYSCNNGVLQQGSASCEYVPPKKNCSASTVSWTGLDGAMCSSSVSSTAHNLTRSLTDSTSNSSGDGAGSANFICNDGVYQEQSSSCAVTYVPPPPQPEPEPEPPQDPNPQDPGGPGLPGINPDTDVPPGTLNDEFLIPPPPGSELYRFGEGLAAENGIVFITNTLTSGVPKQVAIHAYQFNGAEYVEVAREVISDCTHNLDNMAYGSNRSCGFGTIAVHNGIVVAGARYAHSTVRAGGTSGLSGRVWIYKFDYASKQFTRLAVKDGVQSYQQLGGTLSVDDGLVMAPYSTTLQAPAGSNIYRVSSNGVTENIGAMNLGSHHLPQLKGNRVFTARVTHAGGSSQQYTSQLHQLTGTSLSAIGTDTTFRTFTTVTLLNGQQYRGTQSSQGRNSRQGVFSPSGEFVAWVPYDLGKTQPDTTSSKKEVGRLYRASNGLAPLADFLAEDNGTAILHTGFLNNSTFVAVSNMAPPPNEFRYLVKFAIYDLSSGTPQKTAVRVSQQYMNVTFGNPFHISNNVILRTDILNGVTIYR